MIHRTLRLYRDAYSDLPKEIWFLSLVILINRSGAMVIPFMSVYLTQELKFSLAQTGAILSIFGAGAVIGAYLGGWLTDRIGYYPIQFWSLLLTGLLFFLLMWMDSFVELALCIFVLSIVSEAFRPANAASIAFYSDSAYRTRAYSLNRMAINLGFSIGPAIGGLLASRNYALLFWVDGWTCILAALVLRFFLKEKKSTQFNFEKESVKNAVNSAYTDHTYLFFILFTFLSAVCFFQFFSILPVYLKLHYHFGESLIGLFMSLNGLIIVFFEMILVYKLEEKNKLKLISYGVLLVGISYIILNMGNTSLLVWLMIIILTIGEILSMPFMNVYVVERSEEHNRGQYMALHTMAYSAAHIFSPILGTQVVENFDFATLWYVAGGLSFLSFIGFRFLTPNSKNN